MAAAAAAAAAVTLLLVVGRPDRVPAGEANPWPSVGGMSLATELPGVYVVRPGDTLWDIARALAPGGDPRALVHELAEAAGGAALEPGQRIVLDAAEGIAVPGISLAGTAGDLGEAELGSVDGAAAGIAGDLDEDALDRVDGRAAGIEGGSDWVVVTDAVTVAQNAGGSVQRQALQAGQDAVPARADSER